MAYSRKRVSARPRPLRRNHRYVKKRSAAYTKRRPVRRRGFRKSNRLNRKAVLNITSRKKQDNMRVWLGTPYLPAPTSTPLRMVGGADYMYAWIATARDKDNGSGPAPIEYDPTRTSSHCFMRGLRERIDILTSSPVPWLWRRILFCYKGNSLLVEQGEPDAVLWNETSDGYTRFYANVGDATDAPSFALGEKIKDLIFKGTEGKDYTNSYSAKIDTDRVTVMSDRTTVIKSQNDKGIIRMFKGWYPMNATLIYDEDEDGSVTNNGLLSVNSNKSMGDVYVIDFFSAGLGSTSDDELRFLPTATLYWHER